LQFSYLAYRIATNLCLEPVAQAEVRREEPTVLTTPKVRWTDGAVTEERVEGDPTGICTAGKSGKRVKEAYRKLTAPRENGLSCGTTRVFAAADWRSTGTTEEAAEELPVPGYTEDRNALGEFA